MLFRSLGAWGAVQTTAAGIAIAVGGVMRDTIVMRSGPVAPVADAYIPVFVLEVVLLICAIFVAKPLLSHRIAVSKETTFPKINTSERPQIGLTVTDV